MYSFYGGQKGQDFKITRIFQNRSEDLLADLQARWYSPVNVGDYVFINYGDIAEQNAEFRNADGVVEEQLSNYNRNLKIDLDACGKSYSNSLWQKVYIDKNKEISPHLPESDDNNVFIFIDFEDSRIPIYETILDEKGNVSSVRFTGEYEPYNKNGDPIDSDGNVLAPDGSIISYYQAPGESLIETNSIYGEEYYGFGYRLICCLIGQTPRIEVFHQSINIEDGDPYVTLDITNLEKPKIKFYLQRAQMLNDEVSTIVMPPISKPNVDLITEGEVAINGNQNNLQKATLTNPVLEFELPRAIQYFSGLMFGKGRLSDAPFFTATEETWAKAGMYKYTYLDSLKTKQIFLAVTSATAAQQVDENGNVIVNNLFGNNYEFLNASLFKERFISKINEVSQATGTQLFKAYYRENESLLNYLENVNEENVHLIPWGIYGFDKNKVKNNFIDYCKTQVTVFKEILSAMKVVLSAEENIDLAINNSYWGKYGLPSIDEFNGLLTLKDKKIFCSNYIDGLEKIGSIVPVVENLQLYTPIRDFKQTIIDICNCEEENYYFAEMQGKYFRVISLQAYQIDLHCRYVITNAMPGDIYIHNPSGRIYQFTKINFFYDENAEREELYDQYYAEVRYMGTLTAPAPEIESTYKPSFTKNELGEYEVNQISVVDNILVSSETQGLTKEKYIFRIPKTPEFSASQESTLNEQPPVVDRIIIDNETNTDGIYDLHFSLPRAIHMYTDVTHPEEITGFSTVGEGTPIISITNSNDALSKGDIYLYTAWDANNNTFNVLDELRGYLYVYNGDGSWTRQGSIVGPIGVPKTSKTITFVRDMDLEKGQVVRIPEAGELQYYKYSWLDELDEVIQNYNIADGVPNSLIGEAYIFQAGVITDDVIQIQESWWGQYYETEGWSLTLITGQSILLNEYEDNENIIKNNTYTADYLNRVIPNWDVDNYY